MPTRCISIAMLHVCVPASSFQNSRPVVRRRHTLALLAHLHTSRVSARPRARAPPQPSHSVPSIGELAHRVAFVRPCPSRSRKNAALQVCNAAIRVAFAMRPVRPSLRSSASVDGRGRPSVRPSTFRRTRVPMRAHHHRAPIGTD